MKKVILFTAFLLTTTLLFAQSPQGPQEQRGRQRQERISPEAIAKRNTEWMTKELNLTAEQVAPVDSINLVFAKAQQVIFQSAGEDRQKFRENLQALEKEKETSLSGVLTAEQLELYKKKREEMTRNRRRP
jgi:hypothetical protein